jgi:hypothetical protein
MSTAPRQSTSKNSNEEQLPTSSDLANDSTYEEEEEVELRT